MHSRVLNAPERGAAKTTPAASKGSTKKLGPLGAGKGLAVPAEKVTMAKKNASKRKSVKVATKRNALAGASSVAAVAQVAQVVRGTAAMALLVDAGVLTSKGKLSSRFK